ncbi:hypothetical protein AAMO2058_001255400 [Amorphochlora amoebiformis]
MVDEPTTTRDKSGEAIPEQKGSSPFFPEAPSIFSEAPSILTIDISGPKNSVASEIRTALTTWGAFVCVGHGVDAKLCDRVMEEGRKFFSLPDDTKEKYNLKRGGVRWRGYMPVGGERSQKGKTRDLKEGLYLGEEQDANNKYVRGGYPTFGTNLIPDRELPMFRPLLKEYIAQVKNLGDRVMDLISLSLGLPEKYIQEHITENDAISLVRMFHYLPQENRERKGSCTDQSIPNGVKTLDPEEPQEYGIGRHSDYGLWTMIRTDSKGLEFEHPDFGWAPVPQVEDAFIMNVGDVLDRLTGGRYKSRFHRVLNTSTSKSRLSIPFFYDPSWNAMMKAFPLDTPNEEEVNDAKMTKVERWSKTKITCDFDGRIGYSEFLSKKVAKVFPDLVPKELLKNLGSTSEPSTRHHIVVEVPSKRFTSNLVNNIQFDRNSVLKHKLYENMSKALATRTGENALRIFMEHHVWCVWDYFQLLKRLQQHLTCITVPWVPTMDPAMRRFITEIVMDEECDIFEDGKTYGSHLELYIRGMEEIGANTRPIKSFLKYIRETDPANLDSKQLKRKILHSGAPKTAADHADYTIDLASHHPICEVAAVFTFGREDVIPNMFRKLLDRGTCGADKPNAEIFRYYLNRHIELDGKGHAPLAIALVESLCEQTEQRWKGAEEAVKVALRKRKELWDAILEGLRTHKFGCGDVFTKLQELPGACAP